MVTGALEAPARRLACSDWARPVHSATTRRTFAAGTVELDPDTGLPTMLYTGVYLKSNQQAVDRCAAALRLSAAWLPAVQLNCRACQ